MSDNGLKPFAVLRCNACDELMVWPRHACQSCGSRDFQSLFTSGAGHVFAVTTVPPGPREDRPAYSIATIDLAVGGRLMARVPNGLAIGDAVIVSRSAPDAAAEATQAP